MTKEILKGEITLPYTLELIHEENGMCSCHIPEYDLYFSAKDVEIAHKKARAISTSAINYLVERNKNLKLT